MRKTGRYTFSILPDHPYVLCETSSTKGGEEYDRERVRDGEHRDSLSVVRAETKETDESTFPETVQTSLIPTR
jgi:hypothetical protein